MVQTSTLSNYLADAPWKDGIKLMGIEADSERLVASIGRDSDAGMPEAFRERLRRRQGTTTRNTSGRGLRATPALMTEGLPTNQPKVIMTQDMPMRSMGTCTSVHSRRICLRSAWRSSVSSRL